MKDKRKLSCAIINVVIFILTVRSIAEFFTVGGSGNMSVYGSECFRYFTMDSNILCALSSLVAAVYQLRGKSLDKFSFYFRFIGTCAVGLTFVTVMIYIGPAIGYKPMFEGVNFYMHLITPLLAMVNFVLLEEKESNIVFGIKSSLTGLLPMVIYGTVYLIMVIVVECWDDIYAFNANGRWYISVVMMLFVTLVISLALRKTHLLVHKEK